MAISFALVVNIIIAPIDEKRRNGMIDDDEMEGLKRCIVLYLYWHDSLLFPIVFFLGGNDE